VAEVFKRLISRIPSSETRYRVVKESAGGLSTLATVWVFSEQIVALWLAVGIDGILWPKKDCTFQDSRRWDGNAWQG